MLAGKGDPEMVPTFTVSRLTGPAPSSAATASLPPNPQHCGDGLPTDINNRLRSRRPPERRSPCTVTRPRSARFEPVPRLEAERIDQPDLCSQVESVPVIDQFGGNEEDDGQAHLGVPAGDRAVG